MALHDNTMHPGERGGAAYVHVVWWQCTVVVRPTLSYLGAGIAVLVLVKLYVTS